MQEFILFFKALFRQLSFWLFGLFAFIWTIIIVFYPTAPAWIFGVLCLLAFFFACFCAWRDAHREARPYEEASFAHAKQTFDGLNESEKASLRRVVIEKSVAQEPNSAKLERIGFCRRDTQSAHLSLHPDLAMILQRLVREWDSRSGR
jgi:hypothetical protein